MMTDWMMTLTIPPIWRLLLAFAGGAGLGFFYFGGLWWTVRRLASTQNVALLFLASFTLRTVLTLAGFYFIAFRPLSDGSWLLMLTALAGFILIRLLLVRRWGPISSAA